MLGNLNNIRCALPLVHLNTQNWKKNEVYLLCIIIFMDWKKTMAKKNNHGIPLLLNVFLMCIWGGGEGGKFYKLR